jgi:hypothetical protein
MTDVCRVAPRAFENRQWAISPILNPANWLPMHNFLLKSGSTPAITFESRPVAISPVWKSFQQIQKLLGLNG